MNPGSPEQDLLFFVELSRQEDFSPIEGLVFMCPFSFAPSVRNCVFAHTVLCLAPGGTAQAIWKAASVSHFILIAKCESIAIHVILVPEFCLGISLYIKSTAVHKPLLLLPLIPTLFLENLYPSHSFLILN